MPDTSTLLADSAAIAVTSDLHAAPTSVSSGAGALHSRPIVEYLIAGDRRRWYLLLGIWLATALAVATGTFVAQAATGRAPSWFGSPRSIVPTGYAGRSPRRRCTCSFIAC
ncbi:MAG: hypothetical protein HC872_04510 [Gammaproteobacteria bacterium]|nr:hypothetical protein [Gammaproteobacteria bacterium]